MRIRGGQGAHRSLLIAATWLLLLASHLRIIATALSGDAHPDPPPRIVRLIGNVKISYSSAGSHAAASLVKLLEQTVKEKVDASHRNSQLSHLVFVGNLFAFHEVIEASASIWGAAALLKTFIEGREAVTDAEAQAFAPAQGSFVEASLHDVSKLRGLLQSLASAGVQVIWLQGAQELGLTQDVLASIGSSPKKASLEWIKIPADDAASMRLHRMYVTSGRDFGFFTSPINRSEMAFAYYINRLLARSRPSADLALSQAEIAKRVISRHIDDSASATMARLLHKNVMRKILRESLHLASAHSDTSNTTMQPAGEGKQVFIAGHWNITPSLWSGSPSHSSNRGVTGDSGPDTAPASVSVDDVINHYEDLGELWLDARGASLTTNTAYATAYRDIQTLLDMSAPEADLRVVGDEDRTDIKTKTGTAPTVYLGSWGSVRSQGEAAQNAVKGASGIALNTTDATISYTCNYVDVVLQQIDHVSESDSDIRPESLRFFSAADENYRSSSCLPTQGMGNDDSQPESHPSCPPLHWDRAHVALFPAAMILALSFVGSLITAAVIVVAVLLVIWHKGIIGLPPSGESEVLQDSDGEQQGQQSDMEEGLETSIENPISKEDRPKEEQIEPFLTVHKNH